MSLSLRERICLGSKLDERTGCWVWMGKPGPKGYGNISICDKRVSAHRASAHAFMGFDLSSDLFVCHHCDNPPCVNPDHLFIGTALENNRDRDQKGRARYVAGEERINRILSELEVREIISSTEPAKNLAARFGVGERHIYKIKSRIIWRHLNV